MKVAFRPFVAADLFTVRRYMPFNLSHGTRGIVAYDAATAETVAIFIAQEWTGTAAQVHQIIIKPMVLRHGWFEEIANYMFNKAGRIKLFGLVPDNNPRAISVNEKCGFRQVARLEDAYDVGVDYIVMELKREDCPFLEQKVQMLEAAHG